MKCWNSDPEKRPSFMGLSESVALLLPSSYRRVSLPMTCLSPRSKKFPNTWFLNPPPFIIDGSALYFPLFNFLNGAVLTF